MGWFIAANTHGFDSDIIANGRGSLDFLKKLYDTSGQCLECDLRTCNPKDGNNQLSKILQIDYKIFVNIQLHTRYNHFFISGYGFRNFAQAALTKAKGRLMCSSSRQPLKSQRPGATYENSIIEEDENYSEEEDLANVKKKDWSSELLKDNQHSSSASLRVRLLKEILNTSFIVFIILIFMTRRIFVTHIVQ